jgi:hypothetical protein
MVQVVLTTDADGGQFYFDISVDTVEELTAFRHPMT